MQLHLLKTLLHPLPPLLILLLGYQSDLWVFLDISLENTRTNHKYCVVNYMH